jgi:hypothetical protein
MCTVNVSEGRETHRVARRRRNKNKNTFSFQYYHVAQVEVHEDHQVVPGQYGEDFAYI